MERILVLEVNELPKRVLDWWAAREPASASASLLRRGAITETVLDESLPRDLYPSQSWASVGMGVPFEDHGVFWYGDPKSPEHPFYWQAAAAGGRSVGLMGVLHTSPRTTLAEGENYRFVVPDLFGDDISTHPTNLQPIQELHLGLSRQSARVAQLRVGPTELGGAVAHARHGVRASTWAELMMLAAQVGRGAWNKERLRVGQSLLISDVFERQVREHDPDLAVVFVNHVASFMHRYWAATFPEDWANGSGYSDEWVAEHSGELPYAMRALDRILDQLLRLADETDRTLLVVSSMGQQADNTVDTQRSHQAVVRSPARFLAAAGLSEDLETRSAMVPQLTLVAPTADVPATKAALESFLGSGLDELMVAVEGENSVLTVTYKPETDGSRVLLGGDWAEPAEVGMSIEAVGDHRSGRHSVRGVLVSSRSETWPDVIDAFEFAPMILDRLGVPALPHHRSLASA